eukprot:1157362-Pelagomonas_calceolata.AAC.9
MHGAKHGGKKGAQGRCCLTMQEAPMHACFDGNGCFLPAVPMHGAMHGAEKGAQRGRRLVLCKELQCTLALAINTSYLPPPCTEPCTELCTEPCPEPCTEPLSPARDPRAEELYASPPCTEPRGVVMWPAARMSCIGDGPAYSSGGCMAGGMTEGPGVGAGPGGSARSDCVGGPKPEWQAKASWRCKC